MSVFYGITSFGKGQGGHFHSLKATATEFSIHTAVSILNFGTTASPVLSASGLPYSFLPTRHILSAVRQTVRMVRAEKPDLLHAFDRHAYFFFRVVSMVTGTPVVVTKCGGANPSGFFPRADNLVLYSRENFDYFAAHKKFSRTRLWLIPNRVSKPSLDFSRTAEIAEQANADGPIFLRITRISRYYEHSIRQSLNLVKRLRNVGIKANLVVVGVVQDWSVYNALIAENHEYLFVFTDDTFTTNASELIGVADFVIGTGRGFMEAACVPKPVLSPTANLTIPVFVSCLSVRQFAAVNFSERATINRSDSDAFNEVVRMIRDAELRENTMRGVHEYILAEFGSAEIPSRHHELYRVARPVTFTVSECTDLVVHAFATLKAAIRAEIVDGRRARREVPAQ